MLLRILFKSRCKLNWIPLTSLDQLEKNTLDQNPVFAIFKHSTRCPISAAAKARMERSWEEENSGIPVFYVDVIQDRELSNKLAEHFKVVHQSPQILLIKNGECSYNASHTGISPATVAKYR